LVRYNADGTLDTSFDGDGKVTTSFTKGPAGASGVAIQPDGKIVAAGTVQTSPYSRLAVARYNQHGALDVSFSGDGKAVTHFTKGNDEGKAVAIQADGKIIVAGTAGYCCEYTGSFGLVRYNTDGTLDSSFDGEGKVITNVSSAGDAAFDVDVQPDGRIVASGTAGYNGTGSAFAIARYRSGGALDTSFGGDGKDKFRFDSGLNFGVSGVLQSNGKIVISGWTSVDDISSFALARVVGT
jgi:serralysin